METIGKWLGYAIVGAFWLYLAFSALESFQNMDNKTWLTVLGFVYIGYQLHHFQKSAALRLSRIESALDRLERRTGL